MGGGQGQNITHVQYTSTQHSKTVNKYNVKLDDQNHNTKIDSKN